MWETTGTATNLIDYWVGSTTASHPISLYPKRKEITVDIFRGRVDHDNINPSTLQHARDFIIGVSTDIIVQWRAGIATVIINGIVYRIVKGTMYEKRDSISDPQIFLNHVPLCPRPEWLTGVLSALAQFYGIDQESEIVNAIITVAVQASINQFSSIPGSYIASTFTGSEVTDVAIKRGSNLLAGLCPPETEGGPRVWRLRETGEIVEVDREWTTFPIRGGL
jgi:hypothetical protein